jgi:hypothetical protein
MLCGGGVEEGFIPEDTSATLLGGGAGGSSFKRENRLLFLGGSGGRVDTGGAGADGPA